RPVGEDADAVPDREVLLLRGRLVDRDLAAAARPVAAHEVDGAEALVGRAVEADRSAGTRGADRLAVAADETSLVADLALRVLDALHVLHLAQHVCRERGSLLAAVGDRVLRADDGV